MADNSTKALFSLILKLILAMSTSENSILYSKFLVISWDNEILEAKTKKK